MTVPDSQKAAGIAKHLNFQGRIRACVLKAIVAAIDTSDPDKTAMITAGKKIWLNQQNVEIVAMMILADTALLNVCDESNGGAEIDDTDLQSKVDDYLLQWDSVLT